MNIRILPIALKGLHIRIFIIAYERLPLPFTKPLGVAVAVISIKLQRISIIIKFPFVLSSFCIIIVNDIHA